MTHLAPTPHPDNAPHGERLPPPLPRLDPIERLPILVLYPHNRCNCRCTMCDIWQITTREELELPDLRHWLPRWKDLGVEHVLLSGGEPLLHSQFEDFCQELHRAGIGITVHSTGLLLKKQAAVLAATVDQVIVSLDGPQEIHNQIRNIPTAYRKLAEGVEAVHATAPHIPVTGRSTVQRANYRQLRRTVAAAHELGLQRISFLAVDVDTDAFNRPEGWSEEKVDSVALAAADLPHLEAELDALEEDCADDFATGFIAEDPTKLRRRLLGYYRALSGAEDFPPVSCNAPWVSAVIESDGTVRPCFFQPPLGNVHEDGDLQTILNAPEAVAWRRGLDTRRDAICRKCVCSLTLREG